jgi:hypothetical protein
MGKGFWANLSTSADAPASNFAFGEFLAAALMRQAYFIIRMIFANKKRKRWQTVF